MKKRIAVLTGLMMVLCFTFAACGKSDVDLSDSKYVGTWVATSMSVAGEDQGDLEGGVFKLNLVGDGTGTYVSKEAGGEEEVSNITWELTDDGFKTKGDTKLKFKDDGDGIKANIMGVDLHFVREGEAGPDDGAPDIGTQYGYMGQDPVECAVWKYLAEDIASMYDKPDGAVSVPVVTIIKTENDEDGETNIYGDFWVYNYTIDGDTLTFVSGGAHPGKMEVKKVGDEYKVTDFDAVEDGSAFETTAKDIFEEDYEKFMTVEADDKAREELRLKGLADYVKTNGLSVTQVKDYDAEPVKLDL